MRDDKAPFVLEIDDETDEDILSAIQTKDPPPGHDSCLCDLLSCLWLLSMRRLTCACCVAGP